MADPVRVQLDTDKVRALFAEAGGDVVRFMLQQGERVKIRAQELVGVYQPPPAGPERSRAPGTLRDSIVKRFHVTDDGVVVEVGSEDPIALIHHEGTEPHTITASRAPMLVFWSERAGSVIAVKSVQHPGTQPNRFLTQALEVLG
jgi:hypothetical protein